MPITLAKKQGKEPAMVDKDGLIYVLHEEERLTRANDDLKLPAVIRANVYDCVDLLLTSEWDDDDYTNFQSSKINIHPHFFQFDTGNSDGVISGMEYEMSVRPFTMWGKKTKHGLPAPMVAKLTGEAKAGATSIKIQMAPGATAFHVNTELMVGMDCLEKGNDPAASLPRDKSCQEVARVKEIKGDMVKMISKVDIGNVHCSCRWLFLATCPCTGRLRIFESGTRRVRDSWVSLTGCYLFAILSVLKVP
jgi:hypothetical protein